MPLMAQKRETLKNRVEKELMAIQHTNDGILRPGAVVRFAKKHKNSALHTQFQWDVTKAAEAFWLEQARRVIRVHVVIHGHSEEPFRAFVSLEDDRVGKDGGGYRLMVDVMSDSQRRASLLHQALKELSTMRRKYACLAELAKVFEAMEDVQEGGKAA